MKPKPGRSFCVTLLLFWDQVANLKSFGTLGTLTCRSIGLPAVQHAKTFHLIIQGLTNKSCENVGNKTLGPGNKEVACFFQHQRVVHRWVAGSERQRQHPWSNEPMSNLFPEPSVCNWELNYIYNHLSTHANRVKLSSNLLRTLRSLSNLIILRLAAQIHVWSWKLSCSTRL